MESWQEVNHESEADFSGLRVAAFESRRSEDMARLIERWGLQPLPGIHAYYWETSQELKDSVLSGLRSIEPGIPARETNLVKSLARAVGTSGKMPLRGPFLSPEEVDEIVAWIDGGMPENP